MKRLCECGCAEDRHERGGDFRCFECECSGFMPEDPDNHYPDRDREDDQ